MTLHQRNPNAPKFEDRSQEATEWQERWAREAAWRLAKSVFKKIKGEKQSNILLTCGKPASTLEPEEREFVLRSVDAHDQRKGL